jgi:hypothetical protein
LNVDEAFTMIRAYTRANNRRLSDVAHLIVTDLASIPELSHA